MYKIQLGFIRLIILFLPLLVGCAGHLQPHQTVERYMHARIQEAAAKSEALDMLSKKSREAIDSASEPTEESVEYEITSERIIDGESIVEIRVLGATGDTPTMFVLKQEDKAWKIYKIGDAKELVNLETWHPTKGPIQVATERITQDFRAAMIRAFENQGRKDDVTVKAMKTPQGKQFKNALRDMNRSGAPDAKQAIDQLRKTIETRHFEQ